jgi:hypothetical protein
LANEVPRLHRLCEALRVGLPDAHFRFYVKGAKVRHHDETRN